MLLCPAPNLGSQVCYKPGSFVASGATAVESTASTLPPPQGKSQGWQCENFNQIVQKAFLPTSQLLLHNAVTNNLVYELISAG